MDLYSGLFESMVSCCGRIGLRHGPVYTIAMLALGLGVSFNILSVTDLLWTLGLLDNPYHSADGLHPQRYLCALLCVAFTLNTILARRKFSADHGRPPPSRLLASPAAAPAYILGSAAVFVVTLTIELRTLA